MKTDRIQGIIFTGTHQSSHQRDPKHTSPAKFITARLKSLIFSQSKTNGAKYSQSENPPAGQIKDHVVHSEAEELIVNDLFNRLRIPPKDY